MRHLNKFVSVENINLKYATLYFFAYLRLTQREYKGYLHNSDKTEDRLLWYL